MSGSTGKKVLVALSGGVDSAVTAALLIEQGYDVVGVYMQLLPGKDSDGSAAAQVANELGIAFHLLDCTDKFSAEIIADFCSEYQRGHTPNPCVLCNRQLKFGYLLQMADRLGIEFLATGHYAEVGSIDGVNVLKRGSDSKKDQSYFLFTLSEAQLSRIMFPLASMNKAEVLQVAQRCNLSALNRGESQDICFIPDNDYVAFLEKQDLQLPGGGEIIHIGGKVLGSHGGIYRYTIGQRRGLGIGWSEPLYVVDIDATKNQIVVGEKQYLSRTSMVVGNVCWAHAGGVVPARVDCRIRYQHQQAFASINILADGCVAVEFETAQTGITPGQAAVFYDADCVIGGGWIK